MGGRPGQDLIGATSVAQLTIPAAVRTLIWIFRPSRFFARPQFLTRR